MGEKLKKRVHRIAGKRILAFIICTAMILSLLPVSDNAYAANSGVTPTITYLYGGTVVTGTSITVETNRVFEMKLAFPSPGAKAGDSYAIELPSFFIGLNEGSIKTSNAEILPYVDFTITKDSVTGKQTLTITFKADVEGAAFAFNATAYLSSSDTSKTETVTVNGNSEMTIISKPPVITPDTGVGTWGGTYPADTAKIIKYNNTNYNNVISEGSFMEDTSIDNAMSYVIFLNRQEENAVYNGTITDELPTGVHLFYPSAPDSIYAGDMTNAYRTFSIYVQDSATAKGSINDGTNAITDRWYVDYNVVAIDSVKDKIAEYIQAQENAQGHPVTVTQAMVDYRAFITRYLGSDNGDSQLNASGELTIDFNASLGYRYNTVTCKYELAILDSDTSYDSPSYTLTAYPSSWGGNTGYYPLYTTGTGGVLTGTVYSVITYINTAISYRSQANPGSGYTLASLGQVTHPDDGKSYYAWTYSYNGIVELTLYITADGKSFKVDTDIQPGSFLYGKCLGIYPFVYFDQDEFEVPSDGILPFNNTVTYNSETSTNISTYTYKFASAGTVVVGAVKRIVTDTGEETATALNPDTDTKQTYQFNFEKVSSSASIADGDFTVYDRLDKNLEYVAGSMKIYVSSDNGTTWTPVSTNDVLGAAVADNTNSAGVLDVNLKAYYDSVNHYIVVTNTGVGDLKYAGKIKVEFELELKNTWQYGERVTNYFGNNVETLVDHKIQLVKVDEDGVVITNNAATFDIEYTTDSDYTNAALKKLKDADGAEISSLSTGISGIVFALYRMEGLTLNNNIFYLKITEKTAPANYNGISGAIWVKATLDYTSNKTVYEIVSAPAGVTLTSGTHGMLVLTIPNEESIITSVSTAIEGTKHLDGRSQAAGEFEFIVTQASADITKVTLPGNATNTSVGTFKFGSIEFTEAGTYHFTVSEKTGADDTIDYDDTVYTVTIVVKENAAGNALEIDAITYATAGGAASGIAFENTYTQPKVSYEIEGTKQLNGRSQAAGEFEFIVTQASADITKVTLPGNAANTLAGTFKFGSIEFTEVGTYHFTVSEKSGTDDTIDYDDTVYTVTIVVKKNAAGSALEIDSITYATDDGAASGIAFENTYTQPKVSYEIEGTKQLNGRGQVAGEFEFIVTQASDDVTKVTLPGNAANTSAGTFKFGSIEFTETGTYHFIVSEMTGADARVDYDDTVYIVTIVVKKFAAESALGIQSVTYATADGAAASSIAFYNVYTPQRQPVTTGISGNKLLTGRDLQAGEFTFILSQDMAASDAAADIPSGTATNSAAAAGTYGQFEFSNITFDAEGLYVFNITEVDNGLQGITYDHSSYTVTMTVVYDSGSNAYIVSDCTVECNGSEVEAIIFENTYTPEPEPGSFTWMFIAAKQLFDSETNAQYAVNNGEFNFQLIQNVESSTAKVLNSDMFVSNDASGYITVDGIVFEQAGTYVFTLSEVGGTDVTMTYDPTVYTLIVKIFDNNGQLALESLTIEKPDNQGGRVAAQSALFTNWYTEPSSTEVTIAGAKVLTGRAIESGEFGFRMMQTSGPADTDWVLAAADVLNTGGSFKFDPMTFYAPGEYRFTIFEVPGTDGSITYDTRTFEVVVTVTEDAETGVLSSSVQTPEGGVVFRNTYTAPTPAPTTATITGTKQTVGKELTAGQFEFTIYDSAGNKLHTVTNAADGSIVFPTFTYTQTGVYMYQVKETSTSGNGWTVDNAEYTIGVAVNNIDGVLVADVSYPAGGMVFTNTYTANPEPTTLALTGTKTVEGARLVGNQFSFSIRENATGNVVATGSNNASGVITFGSIRYTQAGNYVYTVQETSSDGNGWTTDKTVYTITVVVTVGSDGNLTARLADGSPQLSFHNVYTTTTTTTVTPVTTTSSRTSTATTATGTTTTGGTTMTASSTVQSVITPTAIAVSTLGATVTIEDEDVPLAALSASSLGATVTIDDEEVPGANMAGNNPQTGDDHNLFLYKVLLILSAAALIAVIIKKRRIWNNNN